MMRTTRRRRRSPPLRPRTSCKRALRAAHARSTHSSFASSSLSQRVSAKGRWQIRQWRSRERIADAAPRPAVAACSWHAHT